MSDHHHHGHDDHHDDHHDGSAIHGSMKDYVIGFILSVILTAIPFWLVMNHVLAPAATGFVILGFAVVQMIVHMVYFLHMNGKSEGGWNMLALMFTIITVVIAMAGSIWVMYHMNHNMMPTMPAMPMEGATPQNTHDMP